MQKIISYNYPNRVELFFNQSGFSVEYTNVYQRHIKIYNGISNTIEFDIKNADQKRIDLTTLDSISLSIMDTNGYPLNSEPYELVPTNIKGIATVTIPHDDISSLSSQFLKYSVIAHKDNKEILLYCDSNFGAIGTIELLDTVTPIRKPSMEFNTFTSEIDYTGNVLHHSSAIPATFYEAIPTTSLTFSIKCTDFVGTIYLVGTTDSTISVESFRSAPQLQTWSTIVATTTTIKFSNVDVSNYKYFRIMWHTPKHGFFYGAQSPYNIAFAKTAGVVNTVIVT